jgi:hypothetical protein
LYGKIPGTEILTAEIERLAYGIERGNDIALPDDKLLAVVLFNQVVLVRLEEFKIVVVVVIHLESPFSVDQIYQCSMRTCQHYVYNAYFSGLSD